MFSIYTEKWLTTVKMLLIKKKEWFMSWSLKRCWSNGLSKHIKHNTKIVHCCSIAMTSNWCCNIVVDCRSIANFFLVDGTDIFFNNIFSCLIRSVVVSKEFEMWCFFYKIFLCRIQVCILKKKTHCVSYTSTKCVLIEYLDWVMVPIKMNNDYH